MSRVRAVLREAFRRALFLLLRLSFGYRARNVGAVPPRGPCLLVSNHPSYLDPLFIGVALRRPVYYLAWDALFRVPLLGRVVRAFGAVPLDLERPGIGAWRAALALLEHGEVVGIFPEGGRTVPPAVMNAWKPGAIHIAMRARAPIVPVGICGAETAWPPGQRLPGRARVLVRFLSPVEPPAAGERRDREAERAFAEEVRAEVARRIERRRRATSARGRRARSRAARTPRAASRPRRAER